MLKLRCMSFLILPFLYFSQSNKLVITGTKQSWAGGICCSSGTNYVLHLSPENFDLQSAVIEKINVDGNCISSGWQSTVNEKTVTLSFGTRYDYSNKIHLYDERVHKDHRCPAKNSIRLLIDGKAEEFTIAELEELPYLAYP